MGKLTERQVRRRLLRFAENEYAAGTKCRSELSPQFAARERREVDAEITAENQVKGGFERLDRKNVLTAPIQPSSDIRRQLKRITGLGEIPYPICC